MRHVLPYCHYYMVAMFDLDLERNSHTIVNDPELGPVFKLLYMSFIDLFCFTL